MRRKLGLFRDMHFELAVERRINSLGEGRSRTRSLLDVVDRVDRIVVTASHVDTGLIAELNTICRKRQVKLSVVSPLRGRALPSLQIAQLADLPILEYNTWDASRSSLVIKRSFDVIVSGSGCCSWRRCSRCRDRDQARQPRPGVLLPGPRRPRRAARSGCTSSGRCGSMPSRCSTRSSGSRSSRTRCSSFATIPGSPASARSCAGSASTSSRSCSTCCVGEMSIVGPRPEQVEIVERYTTEDRVRLTVKPGITGPMQIFGRGELTFGERMAVELEYIENPSLARDLRIVLHTVPAVLRGTGAF